MARMRPEEIDGLDRATPGELKVFHFLREAARPHRDFVCWYRPLLGGAGIEPDFVLYGRHLGLWVLEVKDWVLPQIVAADQHQFVLRVKDREERKINPDRQAKNYVDVLLEALSWTSRPIAVSSRYRWGGWWSFPTFPRQITCNMV